MGDEGSELVSIVTEALRALSAIPALLTAAHSGSSYTGIVSSATCLARG